MDSNQANYPVNHAGALSKFREQSYLNHVKYTPIFHFVLSPITLIALVASIVHTIRDSFTFSSILLVSLSVIAFLLVLISRKFATGLQDRIIRQEENFRHFRLTGQPLDSRLDLGQILALRFAEDEQFLVLCQKAVETGMTNDEIKKSITLWRADHIRI